MKPRSMRLLIAEHNFSTGTETVSLGIIPELAQLVECVVCALPPHRIEFYKRMLPPSDRLIYEEIFWPPQSRFHWRALALLQRMDALQPRNKIVAGMRARLTGSWLRHLIHQHRLTHFFTTWIFNVDFPKLPVPIGAMAMDLNWQHFPENFPKSTREALDRSYAKWLAGSDVVFPISDFTADEIRQAFPLPIKRMNVVPHGACVFPAAPSANAPASRTYFYYPASVFAHKDHRTVIEAAIELFSRGHDFDLIFSGGNTDRLLGSGADASPLCVSLRSLLAERAYLIEDRIKCLGIVDRSEVEALVGGARALVLPSRFEGFGLPLLEAIERGARVICTDIPPFLEQIRRYDYADYSSVFPAGNVARLAGHMEAELKSSAMPRPAPGEITARTQRWTWKNAAVAYVDALQEA